MSHPNRNWRKAWTVDPSTLTATHESGMSFVGKLIDGGIDVEVDQATMPVMSGMTSDDIIELGRVFGRRAEEGGRLLLEALK